MKKFSAGYIFILLGSFFIFGQVFAANTDIIINEIGAYTTSTHEWIEIWNKGVEPVDLTGWKFWENNTNHGLSVSTTDAIVSAGEYAVIAQDAGQFILDYPNFSGSVFDSSWSSLSESGEAIGLKDNAGNFVEQFTYISAPNYSLQRRDSFLADYTSANWAEHASGNTVGVINNFETPILPESTTISSTQASSASQISGAPSYIIESPVVASSSPKKTTSTPKKPKEINLIWKVKYNLRLRQNEEGSFAASSTIDPRGGRIAYVWDFGDQSVAGASVKYTFVSSGTHAVVVRATSTAGTVDAKKITVMVYPQNEAMGSGVVFSEVLPNAGADEDEYIRIKNITAATVDVSNWQLAYKNDVYKIPAGTTVMADDYLTFYKAITGFALNDSGGDILLLNQENILMDEVDYGKTKDGAAYVFDGVKWGWFLPEPDQATTTEKNTGKKLTGRFFTNIADARAGAKGDWARVKGVVAVLPGVFGSQYFYLTDGSASIQIYQNKKDFPELAVGDLVQAYGKISEANGIKRIDIKSKNDVDILAIGQMVSSTELNLDEIDESLAGGLVSIQGEITEIKSNFMYLDNGESEAVVYFKQGAKIDKHKFQKGENARVTGILEQTKTGWQIWPRSGDDVKLLGPSEDLLKSQAAQNTSSTSEKYATATAGGVATLMLGFLLRARGALIKRIGLAAIGFIKKDKG